MRQDDYLGRATATYADSETDRLALSAAYLDIRQRTENLCQPLEIEDYLVQTMADASPVKWHLAHTTWFFETFVLERCEPDSRPFHPSYSYLFNSYYNAVGERWQRSQRGILSRPTVKEIYAYRKAVDERLLELLRSCGPEVFSSLRTALVLGLNHEQQHQELLLTDIKHAFACNPLRPAYSSAAVVIKPAEVKSLSWSGFAAGVRWIGHDGNGFAFDNESPRHRVFVEGFQIANRLVTVSEYLAFMEDGGYFRPELWLSDGWNARNTHGWQVPLYWERRDDEWWQMTLHGMRPVDSAQPVCHLSYYEADAYARWAGARLATEPEWQTAARDQRLKGNFVESGHLHPVAAGTESVYQFFGDVWEWTASPYTAYPRYRPAAGALGEYNGKFMCNQMVLHGGSCVTPASHIRHTYRNFFPPEARWQFTGIRLARDA
jgi:ergothioneine biosynthesis protein EgtB